jgi:hypothetical protein
MWMADRTRIGEIVEIKQEGCKAWTVGVCVGHDVVAYYWPGDGLDVSFLGCDAYLDNADGLVYASPGPVEPEQRGPSPLEGAAKDIMRQVRQASAFRAQVLLDSVAGLAAEEPATALPRIKLEVKGAGDLAKGPCGVVDEDPAAALVEQAKAIRDAADRYDKACHDIGYWSERREGPTLLLANVNKNVADAEKARDEAAAEMVRLMGERSES